MRIAIPISYHDQQDIPRLIDIILKFGGLQRHHVNFFPQPSQLQVAKEACARLLPHCANASVIPIPNDLPINNVPQSPNAQFRFVAKTIAQMPDRLPWLWMEADALPIKEGWADALERTYAQARTPFVGNIVPTPYLENGAWFTITGDSMMMGVGMYPAELAIIRDERDIAGRIDELILGPTGAPWTWGVYLRQTMVGMGLTNTNLISDQNGTGNYRMIDGRIMCDPRECDPPRRPRGGQIHSEAVLVHGCKDGSLERLILGESAAVAPEPPRAPAPLVNLAPEPIAVHVAPTIVAGIDEAMAGEGYFPQIEHPDPQGHSALPEDLAKAVESVRNDAAIDAKKLRKRIKAKSTRVGEMAAEWDCDVTAARKRLEEAGFSIIKAGWIKAK